MTNAIKRNFP